MIETSGILVSRSFGGVGRPRPTPDSERAVMWGRMTAPQNNELLRKPLLMHWLKRGRGRCGEAVSKGDHFDSRRAGACLPPVDGGRKARRYAELVD